MIPEFNERGYLPPGIHLASLDEIIERFGRHSEVRQAQADSLQWLIPLCREAGVTRCLLNGSFVTDVFEPNDVDCVLLQGEKYRRNSAAAQKLFAGLPFLEIKVVQPPVFEFYAEVLFASDRDQVAKGIVEVILA